MGEELSVGGGVGLGGFWRVFGDEYLGVFFIIEGRVFDQFFFVGGADALFEVIEGVVACEGGAGEDGGGEAVENFFFEVGGDIDRGRSDGD